MMARYLFHTFMAVALLGTMGGCSDGTDSLSKQDRLGVNGFGKTAQQILDSDQSQFENPEPDTFTPEGRERFYSLWKYYVPTYMEALVRPIPENKKLYLFSEVEIPKDMRDEIIRDEIKSWQFYNYGTIYLTRFDRSQTKDVDRLDTLTKKTTVKKRVDELSIEIPHLTPGVAIWLDRIRPGHGDHIHFKEVEPQKRHPCIDFGGVALDLETQDLRTICKKLPPNIPRQGYHKVSGFSGIYFKDQKTGLWVMGGGYSDKTERYTFNTESLFEESRRFAIPHDRGECETFTPLLLADNTWGAWTEYETKTTNKFKPSPQGVRVKDRAPPPEKVRKKEEPAEIPKAEPQQNMPEQEKEPDVREKGRRPFD